MYFKKWPCIRKIGGNAFFNLIFYLLIKFKLQFSYYHCTNSELNFFFLKLLLKAVYWIEEVRRIAGRFMDIGASESKILDVLFLSKLLAKYGGFIDYKSKLLISILHNKSYSDATCMYNNFKLCKYKFKTSEIRGHLLYITLPTFKILLFFFCPSCFESGSLSSKPSMSTTRR